MSDITFEFATHDDCLDKMVPSDLRVLVAERDRLIERNRKLELQAVNLPEPVDERNDEDKLLHLFKLSHGEMTGACRAEVIRDDEGNNTIVACVKHCSIRWTATREELVFDYITRDMN